MNKALVYFAAALLPVLAIVLGQGPLLSLQSRFHDAKEQYQQALQTSRMQLLELGHELHKDPALAQNLDQQVFATVSRILSGYAVAGKIDYLAILDDHCQFVAHSEQGILLSSDCPVANLNGMEKEQFQWRALAKYPSLDLVIPMGQFGERAYFLLASSWIRDQWLFQFPLLHQSARDLDLSFGSQASNRQAKLIASEGPSNASMNIANLYSQHALANLYPLLLSDEPATLMLPLFAALMLLFSAVAYLVQSIRHNQHKVQKALDDLHQWAEELMPDAKKFDQEKTLEVLDVSAIRERMTRLVKRNYEQLQRCQQHGHALQKQIVALEARVMEQQAEQLLIQKARSLHQQMNTAAVSHLQKLHDIHSLGEDLSHLTAWKIAKPAQQLLDMGSRWQEELREVSPRKLVRSLSERVNSAGVSELEQSIELLIAASAELGNTAINVTLLSQTLLQELQENIRLADHWHRLMGAHEKGPRPLLELLQDSQSLINLQEKELNLKFENQLNQSLLMEHLKIPESTLTSALYHAQMALLEFARTRSWNNFLLHIQHKQRDSKAILVMSLLGPTDDEQFDKQSPPQMEQQLYLASNLLQGFPLSLTQLPALQGVHALALIWDKNALASSGHELKPRAAENLQFYSLE